MLKNRMIGICFSLAGGVFLSSAGVLIRNIETENGWSILIYRSIFFSIAIFLLLRIIYRKRFSWSLFALNRQGWVTSFILSAGSIFYVFAMLNNSVANVTFTLGVSPLITAILGFLFLREKIPLMGVGAMLIALIGISLMLTESVREYTALGNLFALALCFCFACYLLMVRLNKHRDMLPAAMMSGLITSVCAVILGGSFALSANDLIHCAALGFFQYAGGFAFLTLAVRYIPAAEVALFSLIEIALNPMLTHMFANETPSVTTIVSGGIIMSSVLLYSISRGRFR